MNMDGRQIRLQRLIGDGRCVIIALDHGLFDGPIRAMANLPVTAEKINPIVDAVLLSPGMIRHLSSVFARPKCPLAVVRLNWNTVGSVFASWESSGELAIGRKCVVFKDLPKPRLVIGS